MITGLATRLTAAPLITFTLRTFGFSAEPPADSISMRLLRLHGFFRGQSLTGLPAVCELENCCWRLELGAVGVDILSLLPSVEFIQNDRKPFRLDLRLNLEIDQDLVWRKAFLSIKIHSEGETRHHECGDLELGLEPE
jgi:hypothetical protein